MLRESITHGLGNRPVRWVMLMAPFTGGVIDLRLLCDAALPARVVRQRTGVCRSPGSPPRSSRVRRLPAACWCRISGACSAGARSSCSSARSLSTSMLAIIGLAPTFWVVIALLVALGADVCRADARAPGVPECADPVGTARHGALVRLALRVVGGGGDPAGSRENGGRLGLSSLLSGERGHSGACSPFCWLAMRERTAADAMDEI